MYLRNGEIDTNSRQREFWGAIFVIDGVVFHRSQPFGEKRARHGAFLFICLELSCVYKSDKRLFTCQYSLISNEQFDYN